MTECNCTLTQRCLGDGCRYCQPQLYIDHLKDSIEDLENESDRLEQAEKLIDELESALSEAKYCLDGYYGFSGEIEKALASAKAWKDGT